MKVGNEDNKSDELEEKQKSKDLVEADKTKAKQCTQMQKEGNKNEMTGNNINVASEQMCSENTP